MNSRGPAEIKTPALKYQEGLSMAIIHVRIDERLGDCLKLIEAGIKLSEINVGNMAYKEGAKQIKKSVSVTKEDVEVFKKLDSLGVKMTARMIPDEPAGNFMDLIKDMI